MILDGNTGLPINDAALAVRGENKSILRVMADRAGVDPTHTVPPAVVIGAMARALIGALEGSMSNGTVTQCKICREKSTAAKIDGICKYCAERAAAQRLVGR